MVHAAVASSTDLAPNRLVKSWAESAGPVLLLAAAATFSVRMKAVTSQDLMRVLANVAEWLRRALHLVGG